MAANAALKSRTQLLETFMGLQEPAHDAEHTGTLCSARRICRTDSYLRADMPRDQPDKWQSWRVA